MHHFSKDPMGAAASFMLLMFTSTTSRAQCSDAGVCSVGAPHSESRGDVAVRTSYGSGGNDNGLKYTTVQLEASFRIWEGVTTSFVLPSTGTGGPLGLQMGSATSRSRFRPPSGPLKPRYYPST